MRVPAGHRQIRVPHELLDRLRAGPAHGQVRPERVPKRVRPLRGELGSVFEPLDNPPDDPFGQRFSIRPAQHAPVP